MVQRVVDRDQSPMSGLRVIDCTSSSAGCRATTLMADYGADVIRVSAVDDPPLDPVDHAVFARNKQLVVLDLADEPDRQRLRDLLADADVFVVDRSPDELAALGVDFDRLHTVNRRLIYCALSATGPSSSSDGDWLPLYEGLVHALVGTMGEQVGFREPPIYEGLPFAGIGMAYLAQIGILTALHCRQESGVGRLVETSMCDGALSFLSMLWGHADADDVAAPMAPGAQRLVSRTLVCADGEYLGVHTGAAGAFGRLMSVLGLDDRVPPSSSGDIGVALTDEQRPIIETEVPARFLTADRATWVARLKQADVCAIEALRPTEVFDEPQAKHNSMTATVVDPVLGEIEQVAAPIRFGAGDAPAPAVRAAPRQGHSSMGSATSPSTRVVGAGSDDGDHGDQPPLHGLKVLDLGVWYASGYSSRMLADLGADVVKLEPLGGDQMRGMRRPFQSAHSRKRSLSADLKHPEMAPVIERLMRWADVIHHNMRPGAAERLGIGYEQAQAVNPDIIYLHAPGWGTSGPDWDRQSFAPLVSGYVGAAYEVAGRFNPPTYPVGNEDPGAGMLGAIAVVMALVSGRRGYIELPQVNAAMNQVAHIVRAQGAVVGADKLDALQTRVGPLEGLYRTSDGWICIAAVAPAEANRLADALAIEIDASTDSDLVTDRLEGIFAMRTTDDWLGVLSEARVPAVRPLEAHNNRRFHLDPANQQNHRVAAVTDANGRRWQLDTLIRIAGLPRPEYQSAPDLGEHTAAVLRDIGCSDDAVEALVKAGAVRVSRAPG